MLAVMLARGARAQRARTWSRGCNTALNLRGDRAGYRRDRFRGSPVGTASSPARVSTFARWNHVGKTLSGSRRGTRMRVARWPSGSAASSGPICHIFKTTSGLKSITDGRRLSSSRRTAMRAWEIRMAGCANATPSRPSSPVSLGLGERRARSRRRRRRRRWRRPPHRRRRRSRQRRGPGRWARRMTPSPSTSTSLSETRVLSRDGLDGEGLVEPLEVLTRFLK